MTPAYSLRPEMDRLQQRSLLVGILGAVLLVVGLFADRTQFFRSYLWAYLFWSGMTIGCAGILMLHHVVGGKWGMVIRRFCESGARTLPLMALLIIPILFGIKALYIWSRPEVVAHNPNLQWKSGYLNVPFFIGRTVFYFAIWSLWVFLLIRWSRQLDETGDLKLIVRMRQLSAPGLVMLTVTATFAFIDWIMSLEPHWFSTIYGAMYLMGEVLSAFAFVITILVLFSRQEPFAGILTPQHFHGLGNLVLTFTVLWAYCAFSQFLIIWAGNLPDEIPWYLRRFHGSWNAVAVLVVVFHFSVPFVLLLSRDLKRRATTLMMICLGILAIRFLDVFWLVEPGFERTGFIVHWMDIVAPIGIGGIWVAAFFRNLKSGPVLPMKDPRLEGRPGEMVVF